MNGKEKTGSGAGSKSGAGSENEGQDRGEWRRGESSKEIQKSCGRNVENGGDLG